MQQRGNCCGALSVSGNYRQIGTLGIDSNDNGRAIGSGCFCGRQTNFRPSKK
jgi:hypothetical protein